MNFLSFITAAQTLLNYNLNASAPLPNSHIGLKPQTSAFRKVTTSENLQEVSQISAENQGSYDQIMEERQRLINQYLQLNIQMLEKEIKGKEKTEQVESKAVTALENGEESQSAICSNKKKIKKNNKCGHEDIPHYAKGMCSNCYHRVGRIKKPWRCSHQKLYAAGMCQNCYINNYNKKKREQASRLHNQTANLENIDVQQSKTNQLPVETNNAA